MATGERRIDRWARSVWASGIPSGVERRVLLESPHATQPGFWKTPPGVVLVIVLAFSGIAGVGAFLSSPDLTAWRRGFDAEQALILAGVCFALSTVFVIFLAVSWARQGRERGAAAVVLLTMVPVCATGPCRPWRTEASSRARSSTAHEMFPSVNCTPWMMKQKR